MHAGGAVCVTFCQNTETRQRILHGTQQCSAREAYYQISNAPKPIDLCKKTKRLDSAVQILPLVPPLYK